MNKLMRTFLLIITILWPILALGQKINNINKYSVGLEIGLGHSFLEFENEQDRWSGKINPSGTLNVLFLNRINQKIITELGIGFSAYGLILRGTLDKYIIDFASPHFTAGISYNFQNFKGEDYFIRFGGGLQLGPKKTFVDEFDFYKVTIQAKNRFYYFIRPEIGFRKYFKKKKKGARYKSAYEFGAYLRYNLNTLGFVTIEEQDFETSLEPKGNILGLYFRIMMPTGRKRVKIKESAIKELPPIIYHPR